MVLKMRHTDCPYIGDVATLKADVQTLKDTTCRIEKKIDKFIEETPNKFASKEKVEFIERIIYGIIATFLIAALSYAIKAIYGW